MIGISYIIKKINSKANPKAIYVDDESKRQLIIDALAERGQTDFIIDDNTIQLSSGTKFNITLASGIIRMIIVSKQGQVNWLDEISYASKVGIDKIPNQ